VITFITDAVAAGIAALRSKSTSPVAALITAPEKVAKRGSRARSFTEQVLASVGVVLGVCEAEEVSELEYDGFGFGDPPKDVNAMITAIARSPLPAPISTCFKYAKPRFSSDTCSP
jgi:hypothetical protein